MSLARIEIGIPGTSDTISSSDLRNNFNALYQGDIEALRVEAQLIQDLTVYVNPSNVESYYNQVWFSMTGTPLDFAGGNSPTITAPTTNPKISLLTIDSSGTLEWTYGTEAASPTAPDCPANKLPLAYIYCKVGMTQIVNYEDKDTYTSAGYIYKDIRPFLSKSGIFTEVSSVVQQDGADYDEDFVFGSPSLNDDYNSAHDSRMFFDKSKGAFRAGVTTGTEWDDSNRGLYSFAEGYNTIAGGTYSHAEGSNTTASGWYSHVEGRSGTASGEESHAEGNDTVASGEGSHAEGVWAIASGEGSHAEGSGTASGAYSHAEGNASKAYLIFQHSQAGSLFVNLGDSQFSRVVLRADTTDATQETMYINNDSTYKVVLPASTTWGFKAYIVARSDGGDSSYWEILGAIKRDDSNNTALVGSITKNLIAQDSGASSWDVTAESDDTNEALAIKITGADSTNIRWTCSLELVETGY